MWGIETFWKQKLAGAEDPGISNRTGWCSNISAMPGFVEPTLALVEGDPSDAQLYIIAAPGAVGKSSYARALAAATKSVIVDLARTAPLGGSFFKGELANAFGFDALSNAAKGKIGLVVDALDEAQMKVPPQSFEAGLLDLAGIAGSTSALPAVLLGRALAAEDAFLLLTAHDFKAALFKVEFFDDAQAAQYLINKLPLVAARSSKVNSAFRTHGQPFRDLAESARSKLKALAGCDQTNFAGYAPVLDAICEFALEDGLNPQAKMAKLSSTSQIDLIDDITLSILEREQGKLQGQFKERHPDALGATVGKLYTIEDQLLQVSFHLFGGTPAPSPELPKEAYYQTYQEMVETFGPQHPFVSANGAASNPVFAAYVVAWALRKSSQADQIRKAVLSKPNPMSGIFFELYDRQLQSEPGAKMPLADVGILYQALNSQIAPGQRVQLEVSDDESSAIEVSFEILAKPDSKGDPLDGKTWGPYPSTNDSVLELHSPFSNVYVNAPTIMMQLGDGIVQQIGAPTELSVRELVISAKHVLVQPNGADAAQEFQTATIFAEETDLAGVQTVTVRDGATLSVSWPDATIYPWNSYVVAIPAAADEGVDFLRRRVRRILTAFRSHSKGALVRLAAKIDSNRMTKDERGRALVDKLMKDQILVSFDAGKFYRLDQDIMGQVMGVGYHDLAKSRFTPQLDSYLTDVLAKMPRTN